MRGFPRSPEQWVAAPGVRWLRTGEAREGHRGHGGTLVHVVDVIGVFLGRSTVLQEKCTF